MSSAVITYCRHFFHGNCLRKWLYVQDTCPMCHQTVRPTPQSDASGDASAERDAGPDLTEQEGNQNQDNTSSQETQQSDDVAPDPTEQEEEEETEERGSSQEGACGAGGGDQTPELHREAAAQGLRFSSSGDFVGFVHPVVSSCSTGGLSSSHVPLSKTSPPNLSDPGEENCDDSPLPSTANDVNKNSVKDQYGCRGAGLEDGATFCLSVPQNNKGKQHDRCDWTSKSQESADKTLEVASPGTSQAFVKSCSENSKLLDCVDDHLSHKGNNTYSDSDLDLDPDTQVPRRSPSVDATFSCISTDNSDWLPCISALKGVKAWKRGDPP